MAGPVLGLRVVDNFSARFRQQQGNRNAAQARVTQMLRNIRGEVIRQMAKYPPQLPPVNPKRRYRRTGDYGRSWALGAGTVYTPNSVRIVNRVQHRGRTYAVWVGGPNNASPGQARDMARRGWVSLSTVSADIRRRYRRIATEALVGPNL